MRRLIGPSALLLLLLAVGCAHPIVIAPDVSQIDRNGINPIEANVGYVISDDDRAKEVTTPGGGGDKVRYFPYKELEPALFRTLSNVFRRAYPMKSATDAETTKTNNITFIFVPEIHTESSSTGVLTWPPTDFTVDIACKALDKDGKVIWEKHVEGKGQATYGEFVHDFPLAAKRASLQALQTFQKEVNAAPEFRK